MVKRKIAILGLLFAVFLASPLFISADIYSSNIKTGKSYLWRLRLSTGSSISFSPSLDIVGDCLIQADITRVVRTGFEISNVIMDVSRVGSVRTPENISVHNAVNYYFEDKSFHIITILLLPTKLDDGSSYFDYLVIRGFTVQRLSDQYVVTFSSSRFVYDSKGVLESYTFDNGFESYTMKRMMQIYTIIALGVSGLVLLLGLLALVIILGVRKSRKVKAPKTVEEVKKAIIAKQRDQITPTGIRPVASAGVVFPSVMFLVTFLLVTIASDLMVKKSFIMKVFDPDWSYFTNWDYNLMNIESLGSSLTTIFISVITLASAIVLSVKKTKSESYKELLLKIPLYITSFLSLAAFVLTRVAVQVSYDPLVVSEDIYFNLMKSGLIFENIALFFLILILASSAFLFEDSPLFSYKKPAVYTALIGFIFLFMAGINASNIYRVLDEILLDPIYYDEFQSAYSKGLVFSELSSLFLILAIGIGLTQRAKGENIVLWILSIVVTLVLGIIVFSHSLSLILFNLIEYYPTTEVFTKLNSRNSTLQIFKMIFLLLIIFFTIALEIKPIVTGEISEQEVKEEVVETVQPVTILLCPICSEEVMKDSVFCSKCGAKITQTGGQ
ncbi:MAG: zinc ribbon domain-containing protein [Candidatus Heimdallarchaeota archaeon]|nr:zinc ribbon domain-containing protein [Candidatus Heimdallarchaeota archaeon]MCK4878870.1 zinc ribbon domain-containing protein [Candidatus Heimdallarchaeota archaeon]